VNKKLQVSVSALALTLALAGPSQAQADEALTLEEDTVVEATINAEDVTADEIDNAFGYGNYDAEEILDADLVGKNWKNLADPVDLMIDGDENVAFVLTYVRGDLLAIPSENLTAYRQNGDLILRTVHTREELVAAGDFDIEEQDYRLYSELDADMVGLSGHDDESAND